MGKGREYVACIDNYKYITTFVVNNNYHSDQNIKYLLCINNILCISSPLPH